MAFTDRLRKRISSPVGFAGGTLEEQLLRAAQEGDVNAPPRPAPEHGGFIRGPQPTMADQAMAHAAEPQPALAQPMARSRSFKDALLRPMQPTGSFEPPQPTQTTNLGQGSEMSML